MISSSRSLTRVLALRSRLTTAGLCWTITSMAACTARQVPVRPAVMSDSASVKPHSDSLKAVPIHINIYYPGIQRYDYRLDVVIKSIAGDSIPRVDSSQIRAVLTTSFRMPVEGMLEAHVEVDSAMAIVLGHAGTTHALPSQSFAFKISPTTGQVLQQSDVVGHDADSCSDQASNSSFHGTELLPIIHPGARVWTDSSVVRECRGSVRLMFSRTMHYQLAEFSGPLWQLVRVTEARVTGSGSQWSQPVEVSGKGSSVDTFFISQSPPRLQRLSGTSQLEIGFQSQLRSQRFVQAITVLAVVRP